MDSISSVGCCSFLGLNTSKQSSDLEAKVYIFAVIEPNCSIIAACLPCYGPLLKGGRGAESLVASVRSAISLFSFGSQDSRNASRRNQPGSGSNKQVAADLAQNDSELQLTDFGSTSHSRAAHVEAIPHEEEDNTHEAGIKVTRGYETNQEPL
jgi:hypothetical protein